MFACTFDYLQGYGLQQEHADECPCFLLTFHLLDIINIIQIMIICFRNLHMESILIHEHKRPAVIAR